MKTSDAQRLAGHLATEQLERIIERGKASKAMLLAARTILDLRRKGIAVGSFPIPRRERPSRGRGADKSLPRDPKPTQLSKSVERRLAESFRVMNPSPQKAAEMRRAKEHRERQQAQHEAALRRTNEQVQREWRPTSPSSPTSAATPSTQERPSAPSPSAPSLPARPTPTRTKYPALSATTWVARDKSARLVPAQRGPSEHQRLVKQVRQLCGEVRTYRYSIEHNRALLHDLDDTTLGYLQRASAARHDSDVKHI